MRTTFAIVFCLLLPGIAIAQTRSGEDAIKAQLKPLLKKDGIKVRWWDRVGPVGCYEGDHNRNGLFNWRGKLKVTFDLDSFGFLEAKVSKVRHPDGAPLRTGYLLAEALRGRLVRPYFTPPVPKRASGYLAAEAERGRLVRLKDQ